MNTILRRSIGALTMVSAVLIGPIGASAASPEGIQGNVTVVNDETSPVPVTIENGGATIVEYRYIGATAATTDGSAKATTPSGGDLVGVAALHRMCAIEYGEGHPGVRAATQLEASLATAQLPEAAAWVVATDLSAIYSEIFDNFVAVDLSTGRRAGDDTGKGDAWLAVEKANCAGYTEGLTQNAGPALHDDGFLYPSACSFEHGVACAAPVVFSVGQ